jgi:glycosyltransferase involved in cell wall biosynthesis
MSAQPPKVTIVTPSYNQGDFLEATIVSVLEQDYPNLEYFVVDDGSTDGSEEVIRRYADRLAWWTIQENAGQVAALNRGFARANGEYLGWLNSDDVLLPGAIGAVVAELESDPELLLVYGDNVFIDETGRELAAAPAQEFDLVRMIRHCENGVPQPGSLFRRRSLEIAPLNERGYYFFDYEFAIRLGTAGRVKHIAQNLAGYRLHPESKTVAAPLRKAGDYVRLAEEFFGAPDFPMELRAHIRAGRASAYISAGGYAYAGLDLPRARRYLLRGLALARGRVPARALGIAARSFQPRWLVARERTRRAGRVAA